MARDFYPFVEKNGEGDKDALEVHHPARVAVYDDASAAPRVVVIEPRDVRGYLEEITSTVNRLSHEQGGTIPFMVIREIVENFIHAYFQAPTITILDGGNTIRFSDQGPGIKEKPLAMEYGTSSATEEMKRYIRGVGSGLPYVQQYMEDKGGSLDIEDNISGGTVVTISTLPSDEARAVSGAGAFEQSTPIPQMPPQQMPYPQAYPYQQPVQPMQPMQPVYQQPQMTPPSWQFSPQPPTTPTFVPSVTIDDRGRQVLAYLSTHEGVGPSELTRAYGASGPTWSRTLSNLAAQGLLAKAGQKYHLTTIGRSFLPSPLQ